MFYYAKKKVFLFLHKTFSRMENKFKYLVKNQRDALWGITINTVGSQDIEPDYEYYPPQAHPKGFLFNPTQGRRLDSYQLVYITRGKGTLYTEENHTEINEGDMILLPPHIWHSYYPNKKSGWKEYWIGFEGAYIDKRFDEKFFPNGLTIYNIGVKDKIVDLYEQAINIANEEKSCHQQFLAGIANLILGMTIYYNNNKPDNDIVSKLIDKAKVIIRNNIFEDINLEDIANQVNMSYSWFRKQFKSMTGLSPAHYIQDLRVKQAKEIISTTNLSIKEIAFKLCFDNTAYFIKVFKKHTGYSPADYRKSFTTYKKVLPSDKID